MEDTNTLGFIIGDRCFRLEKRQGVSLNPGLDMVPYSVKIAAVAQVVIDIDTDLVLKDRNRPDSGIYACHTLARIARMWKIYGYEEVKELVGF